MMRKGLALFMALCLALGLAGCGGQTAGPATPSPAPTSPGLYDAGAAALAQGDPAGAVEAFSKAIQAGDDRAAAYAGRADGYLALSRTGEDEPGPSFRVLALRDYEIALALDPGQGPHIYEVYAGLADEALAAGAVDEALSYLRTALAAASGEDADRVLAQVGELTGGILTASVWYEDAPDSRYYIFAPDGTGRVIYAADMEPAGGLTYELEGFDLHIQCPDAGETRDWTYDPDRGSYCVRVAAASAEGGTLDMPLIRLTEEQLCQRWQASILAADADGQLNWLTDVDWAAGCEMLYGRAYGLLEELAGILSAGFTEEDAAAVQAERDRRAAFLETGEGAQEGYIQAEAVAAALLERMGPVDPVRDTVLNELFPVGEKVLTDYCRLLAGWTLDARLLASPLSAQTLAGWEKLADVDHYFAEGRLYLCMPGWVLQRLPETGGELLTADWRGRTVIATPLTLETDVTLTGEALAEHLEGERWISLTDMGHSTEVFSLALAFENGGACSAEGGYYPDGGTGRQSGQYALDGRELAVTLSAEDYAAGTYRYAVVPMGESLYMTLLTDGIVYGQTAGSAYVLCGEGYASEISERMREAEEP